MSDKNFEAKRSAFRAALNEALDRRRDLQREYSELPNKGHGGGCVCEDCNARWMASVDVGIADSRVERAERELRDLVKTHDALVREQPSHAKKQGGAKPKAAPKTQPVATEEQQVQPQEEKATEEAGQ